MTDAPPVPPEIVEKATHALKAALWGPYGLQPPDSYVAAAVLAAVYGDIVEATRREVLMAAADAIRARRDDDDATFYIPGLTEAVRIVAGLRDSDTDSRPTVAPQSVRQGESGSTPTRDGDGPQIAAQGFRA